MLFSLPLISNPLLYIYSVLFSVCKSSSLLVFSTKSTSFLVLSTRWKVGLLLVTDIMYYKVRHRRFTILFQPFLNCERRINQALLQSKYTLTTHWPLYRSIYQTREESEDHSLGKSTTLTESGKGRYQRREFYVSWEIYINSSQTFWSQNPLIVIKLWRTPNSTYVVYS